MRCMCLLVGHWLVTFPDSDTGCSILETNKENYTSPRNFFRTCKNTGFRKKVLTVFPPQMEEEKNLGNTLPAEQSDRHGSCSHITVRKQILTLQHTAVTWRLLDAEEPHKPDLEKKL